MSGFNITRFVETTLKERTTVYSPLIEAIVNSIESIFETGRSDGKIVITPVRNPQISFQNDSLQEIIGFIIEDNGIGFNKKNRDAFDTLCTDNKINTGGKGLGRFIFLKYFKKVRICSQYKYNGKYHSREFILGSKNDIIENENDYEIETSDTNTKLYLDQLKRDSYDKELDTVASKILERILVYFVDDSFKCPSIILKENKISIVLNDLIGENQKIQPISSDKFTLTYKDADDKDNSSDFQVKLYKIIYPGTSTSKICLSAHHRQVTETTLYRYIPEFKDNFFDTDSNVEKNYIVRAYVLGEYLDKNVSLERGEFDFSVEGSDALYPFSQQTIEKEAAKIVEKEFKNQVHVRRERKLKTLQKYVDESAPWFKTYVKELDIAALPYDLDAQTMESALQVVKFKKEKTARVQIENILVDPKTELFSKVSEAVKNIQEAGSSDLTHYVVLRKVVLGMLKKLLEINNEGTYSKEAEVHNLIFPVKSDSETTNYSEHNLWILDEKLNFTELVTSDKAIDKNIKDRPDILIYNKKMAYRSGNEKSNPVTIFEFKQPHRYDFINLSAKEDPIEQIKRYAIDIRERKFTTPEGREIQVDDDTPFYGYLVCDFNQDVRDWLFDMKNFIPMSDGMGYFFWFSNIRLYIEVLTWDKILKDSESRNKIFFKKVGLV